MAWKGPAGLLGEPDTERAAYTAFPVQGRPGVEAFVHQAVLDHLAFTRPTPEGDFLFFVEGFGRLRFRIVEPK